MPPAKKKLSKKEKARLEAEQAELLRLELERERLRKLEEARQRRKLELEQTKRKLKTEIEDYRERRSQLRDSMHFLLDFQRQIEAIKRQEREGAEWSKYMRCNGLPDTNCPGALRTYLHQWHHDVQERNRRSRNWLIRADENTLLTQDGEIEDCSAVALREQQPNLGDLYAERVEEVLGILQELEDTLSIEERKLSHIRQDLKQLRTEMRLFLMDYLDDFTYKITSHVERDMHLERPGTFKHVYVSQVFKNFIWTFSKDAQLTLNNKPRIGEPEEPIEIQFPNIKVNIVLPAEMQLSDSTLRALWLNTDLISDYCSSFQLHKELKATSMNLLQQTSVEWQKRKQILQEILTNCNREISESELESFQQGEDATEQPPPPKEPDVDKLYTEYEEQVNRQKREAMGPESYGLRSTDINLRKYRIIGGLYSIYYLETPQQDKQLNRHTYIRTMHQPAKLLHKVYHENFVPPPPPQPGVRRLPEEIEAEIRMVEKALDKLILISVQLPDSILWFEPPLACRWETETETRESDVSSTLPNPEHTQDNCEGIDDNEQEEDDSLDEFSADVLNRHSTSSEISHKSSVSNIDSEQNSSHSSLERTVFDCLQRPISSVSPSVERFQDFDVLRPPPDIDLNTMMDKYLVTRLPHGLHWCIPPTNKSYIRARQRTCHLIPIARTTHPRLKDSSPRQQKSLGNPKRLQHFIQNAPNLHRLEPGELFPLQRFAKIEILQGEEEEEEEGKQKQQQQQQDNKKQSSTTNQSSKCEYQFSQLLKDLEGLCELERPQDANKLFQQIGTLRLQIDDDNELSPDIREPPTSPEYTLQDIHELNIMTTRTPKPMDPVLLTDIDTAISDEGEQEMVSNSNMSDSDDAIDDQSKFQDSSIEGGPGCEMSLQANFQSDEETDKQSMTVKGKWSARDIHDTKFNEDKLSIQFRTGRLGIFGFALNRYSNMPYQTWELKPQPKTSPESVAFSFTAALISLDIDITGEGYCITSFQGGSTATIASMIGQTLPLETIKRNLISSAVDIFPEEDAFRYTEGSCEKNYVMEMHLYACMSSLALTHNFNWSRWNLLAGSRKAVLLMREMVEATKLANYSTLLVTPLKTAIIDCTEVSASFNTRSIEGMQFYADLYQLDKVHSHPSSSERQQNLDPVLRDNVASLLRAIRPLSFC